MNRITLIGRMGADPEEKKTGFWTANIATSFSWTDKKTNERKTSTDWHTLNFGEHFKGVIPYIKKGGMICIEGKQRCTEKDGKYYHFVQVETVELLSSPPSVEASTQPAPTNTPLPSNNPADETNKGNEVGDSEDLPF